MALDKGKLKTDFKQLFTDMRTREENSDDEFANRFADMIDTYVKSATINYASGLVAPTNGGFVTGVFNGNIT